MASAPLPVVEQTYASVFGDAPPEENLPVEELANEIERRWFTAGVDELANVMLRRAGEVWVSEAGAAAAFAGVGREPVPRLRFHRPRSRERIIFHFVGHGHVPSTTEDELRARFNELARNWREETAFLSSPKDIILNFNYQQIIGMGPAAVPLIIEELRERGGHWFWALRAITQADPLAPSDHGNAARMRDSWLRWWNENEK